MNLSVKYILLIIFSLSFFSFSYHSVLAVGSVPDCDPTKEVCLPNPLRVGGQDPTLAQFIGKVINGILGVVGSLALVMFIYGGLTWMTSAGGAEKVKKGKDILIWAVIGLVIIFSAYALVNFVIFDVVQAPITPAAPAR